MFSSFSTYLGIVVVFIGVFLMVFDFFFLIVQAIRGRLKRNAQLSLGGRDLKLGESVALVGLVSIIVGLLILVVFSRVSYMG